MFENLLMLIVMLLPGRAHLTAAISDKTERSLVGAAIIGRRWWGPYLSEREVPSKRLVHRRVFFRVSHRAILRSD